MKNLQLLLLNFRKKKLFNLIIMIEITIAITLFILVLGKIEIYSEPLKVINADKLQDIFIYGNDKLMQTGLDKKQELADLFYKKIEENKDKIQSYGTMDDNNTITFDIDKLNNKELKDYFIKQDLLGDEGELFTRGYTYDELVAEKLKAPLSEGQYLTDAKVSDDVVPAVLNYKFKDIVKIGDIYDVNYYYDKKGTEEYKYNQDGRATGMVIQGTKHPIKIQVVGFLGKDNQYFLLDRVGMDNYPLTHIYRRDMYEDMYLLKRPDNILSKLDVRENKNLVWMVQVKPEYIDEKQEIMNSFNQIGMTYTFDSMIENNIQAFKQDIKIPMINLIIAMIITIISIAGLNILLKISERKKYGIYYACGCTWKKCVILDILKGVLLIIIPTMLAFTVATIIGKRDYFTILKPSIYIWGLVIAGLIYFISDFLFNLKMYKTKPVDNLREVE